MQCSGGTSRAAFSDFREWGVIDERLSLVSAVSCYAQRASPVDALLSIETDLKKGVSRVKGKKPLNRQTVQDWDILTLFIRKRLLDNAGSRFPIDTQVRTCAIGTAFSRDNR
jgi:hypothetical protein